MKMLKPILLAFAVIIIVLMTMISSKKTTQSLDVEVVGTGVLSSTTPSSTRSPVTHYLDAKLADGKVIRVYSDSHIPQTLGKATIVVETQYSIFGTVTRRTFKSHSTRM